MEPMRKVPIQILLIVFMLSLLSSSTFATDEPKFSAKVRVTVRGDNHLVGLVTSYVKRELRSFHDVKIVDDEATLQLGIIAMELRTKDDRKSGGVALSVAVLEHFSNEPIDYMLRNEFKGEEEGRLFVKFLTTGLFKEPTVWLRVGDRDDLQMMCKELVADFDTYCLEEARKGFREAMKMLEKAKKK